MSEMHRYKIVTQKRLVESYRQPAEKPNSKMVLRKIKIFKMAVWKSPPEKPNLKWLPENHQ